MKSKVFAYGLLIALLIAVPIVLAINVDINWTANVDNFDGQVYHCLDAVCSQVGEKMMDLSSGDSNEIQTSFSAASGSRDNHAVYFNKACFIPKGLIVSTSGDTNWSAEAGLNFNKKFDCSSEIQDVILSSGTVGVGQQLFITANIKSAFSSAGAAPGSPKFIPEELKNKKLYSSSIMVKLSVLDGQVVVHNDSKIVDVLLDESEDVTFTWMPLTRGDYRIRIDTVVVDCKCASNEEMHEIAFVTVTEGSTTTTTTTSTTTTVDGSTTTTTTVDGTTTIGSSGGGGGGGTSSSRRFSISDIRFSPSSPAAGDLVKMTVELSKDTSRTISDMIIMVDISQLGVRIESGEFEFRDRKESKDLSFTIPLDAKKQDYVVKVTAKSKAFTRIEFVRLPVTIEGLAAQVQDEDGEETGLEGITGQAVRIDNETGSIFESLMFRMGLMAVFALAIVYMIFKL